MLPMNRLDHMDDLPHRMERYRLLMQELKLRLLHAETLGPDVLDCSIDAPVSGERVLVWEDAALNVRKALELMAYSSLLANQRYSSRHGLPSFADYTKAKKVLFDLAKVNPDFFPRPVTLERRSAMHIDLFFEDHTTYFTKEEFAVVYNNISKPLHVPNPYTAVKKRADGGTLRAVIERLRKLLQTHVVVIEQGQGLIVQMRDWKNVHDVEVSHFGDRAPPVK